MYAKHSIKQKISVGMLLISVAMILAFMIVAISYSYQVLLQSAASTAIKELDFAKTTLIICCRSLKLRRDPGDGRDDPKPAFR